MLFLLASYYHNFFRRIYNSKPMCGSNNGDPLALILPVPNPVKEKKLTLIFIFILLCGTSKGFMKALKKCEIKNLS